MDFNSEGESKPKSNVPSLELLTEIRDFVLSKQGYASKELKEYLVMADKAGGTDRLLALFAFIEGKPISFVGSSNYSTFMAGI